LLGILTRESVHEVVSQHLIAVREDLLREHSGIAAIAEHGQIAHLISGLAVADAGRVERLDLAHDWIGRSLAELDLRRARNVTVLAIATADKRFLCPPDPSRALEAGDRLVVLSAGKAAMS